MVSTFIFLSSEIITCPSVCEKTTVTVEDPIVTEDTFPLKELLGSISNLINISAPFRRKLEASLAQFVISKPDESLLLKTTALEESKLLTWILPTPGVVETLK